MVRFTLLALLVLALACTQSEARRGRGNRACMAIFKGMEGLRAAKSACRDEADRGQCIAEKMEWVDDNGDWDASAFDTAVTTKLDALVADGTLTQAQSDAVMDAYDTCITDDPSGSGLKDMEKCLVKACSDAEE